jgi:hypothetical protein
MRIDADFHAAYRELEIRMKALAESDGHVFLPSPEPLGPVDYVFVCMEPSLGRWARDADEAKAKVDAGAKNFYGSTEVSILHFCIRRYLCGPEERYHITDLSKGAMLGKHAALARVERYDRWYGLLQEEIDLVATPNAHIVAVGKSVGDYLERQRFARPVTRVIHYSSLAGLARRTGIIGHEERFKEFIGSVSLNDLGTTMEQVLKEAHLPAQICDEALSQLKGSQLTTSHQTLIFNYKLAFESMRAGR